VDLEHERRLAGLLQAEVATGLIASAHDVGRGGLAVALAQCAIAGATRIGAEVRRSPTGSGRRHSFLANPPGG
jgi:phosphoribosylformylglycinamidine synthase